MAILHYVYLLLKMLGKIGVLTFRGDLQRSFECEKEAITYASQIPQEKYWQQPNSTRHWDQRSLQRR